MIDPNRCYVEMGEAMDKADRWLAVARERAKALDGWLKAGGSYPEEHSPEMVRVSINQILLSTCEPEEG